MSKMEQPPFCFLHIPKTGGVTFYNILLDQFSGKERASMVSREEAVQHSLLPVEKKMKYQLVKGHFWFDAEKLDKVFFNIISNAFKYTPQGGLIHISLLKNLDKIDINITDNGIGMTAEEREHAFDLFYRGSQNMSLGSGLGLAITSRAVRLHGGTVGAANAKDGGLEVTIKLPISRNGRKFPA